MGQCDWSLANDVVKTYHDEEWGVPSELSLVRNLPMSGARQTKVGPISRPTVLFLNLLNRNAYSSVRAMLKTLEAERLGCHVPFTRL